MNRFLALALIIGASTFGMVGCEQKTEDKKVETSTTPTGEVKKTETTKVEKTGDAKETAPTTPAETPK